MGYKDITAGTKIGKIAAARFVESKTGTMGIELSFRFEEGQSFETLNWVGWLSEKAIKYTMDTLVNVLGYNGSKEVNGEGVLTDKNAFDFDREVKLVVELEPRVNAEGIQQLDKEMNPIIDPRIKYVNSLSGSGFAAVQPQVVKQKLANIGFDGVLLATMKASGKEMPKQKTELKNHAPPAMKKEEIPF